MTTAIETLTPPFPVPVVQSPHREGLLRLLLRDHDSLNTRLRDEQALPGVAVRLLGMSVLGFALHGVVMGIAAQHLHGQLEFFYLKGHPALWLPLAFVISLVGALGICLPIFYICSQMAGLDAPLHVVAAQALRGNATGSAFLLGMLPFYVAAALGCMAGLPLSPLILLGLGFALPFLSGIAGVRSVYAGFKSLADAAGEDGQAGRRRTLLLTMVMCATFIYLLVAPLALYRLAEVLGSRI